MRATVKLRTLLFKRGIKWSESDAGGVVDGTYITGWRAGNGAPCAYSERVGKYPQHSFKSVTLYNVTPEQAIAVTVGAGTCHDLGDERIFHCSECGCGIIDIYLRDEGVYWDDEGNYIGDKWPRYCPHCGAMVAYE